MDTAHRTLAVRVGRRISNPAAYLEPGLYSVCADPPGGAGRNVTINPMSEELVDPAEEEKKTP